MATNVHRKARLLFVAVLCGGALAGLAWQSWSSSHFRTYRIETHDPVSGLIVDSPVEFHGVEVGKVTNIRLMDGRTVSILLKAANDAPVSKATVATITSRGLAARGFAGYVYIALENSTPASGPLAVEPGQPYPMIPSAPSRMATMDTTVAEATEKVQGLMRLGESVLDEETIASLKHSVKTLPVLTGLLEAVLDEKTIASLKRSFDSVQEITRRLESMLDEKTIAALKRSVEGLQEITAMLAANNKRLDSLIVNAERDSRDIRPLVETSNSTIRELRLQVLPQFYHSISDLQDLTRSVNGMANRLSRDPSALLRGTATPPGPGER